MSSWRCHSPRCPILAGKTINLKLADANNNNERHHYHWKDLGFCNMSDITSLYVLIRKEKPRLVPLGSFTMRSCPPNPKTWCHTASGLNVLINWLMQWSRFTKLDCRRRQRVLSLRSLHRADDILKELTCQLLLYLCRITGHESIDCQHDATIRWKQYVVPFVTPKC